MRCALGSGTITAEITQGGESFARRAGGAEYTPHPRLQTYQRMMTIL